MTWFHEEHEATASFNEYNNCAPEHHKAKLTHELLGGAVAYQAAKAFEEHKAKEGKPSSHAKAKEILAGLAGGIITKEFESKGLDWIDKKKAEKHAEEHLNQRFDDRWHA